MAYSETSMQFVLGGKGMTEVTTTKTKSTLPAAPKLVENWQQLAFKMSVAGYSLEDIKKQLKGKIPNEEIELAFEQSNIEADAQVAYALLRRATGFYEVEEKEKEMYGKRWVERTKKYYPPDIAAITLWLCNRRAETWIKDTSEIGKAGQKQAIQDAIKELAGALPE